MDVIKRPNYFNNQFLFEDDFKDEQNYHREMRRRHNMAMHTPGIAEGLQVTRSGDKAIAVDKGMAIDKEGHEMILTEKQTLDLSDATKFPPPNSPVFVIISFDEEGHDPGSVLPSDPNKFTRTIEKGVVKAENTRPASDSKEIVLAEFKLVNGKVPNDATFITGLMAGPKVMSVGGLTGQIKLLAQGSGITIVPDQIDNSIKFSATGFDLAKRDLASLLITSTGTTPSSSQPLTVPISFPLKFALIIGTITVTLSGREYSGGTVGFYVADNDIKHCFGFGVTKFPNNDWFSRAFDFGGICRGVFTDNSVAPPLSETIEVDILEATPTRLNGRLTRIGSNPIRDWKILLQFLYMG